jgi:hypothetical protein
MVKQCLPYTQPSAREGSYVSNLPEAVRRLGFDHFRDGELNEQRFGEDTPEMVRLMRHELGVHTEQPGAVGWPPAVLARYAV